MSDDHGGLGEVVYLYGDAGGIIVRSEAVFFRESAVFEGESIF